MISLWTKCDYIHETRVMRKDTHVTVMLAIEQILSSGSSKFLLFTFIFIFSLLNLYPVCHPVAPIISLSTVTSHRSWRLARLTCAAVEHRKRYLSFYAEIKPQMLMIGSCHSDWQERVTKSCPLLNLFAFFDSGSLMGVALWVRRSRVWTWFNVAFLIT